MTISQVTYDRAFAALLDIYEEMIDAAEEKPSPFSWDDEYAEIHVEECLDRMIVAGPLRPNDELRARYRALAERATPYSEER